MLLASGSKSSVAAEFCKHGIDLLSLLIIPVLRRPPRRGRCNLAAACQWTAAMPFSTWDKSVGFKQLRTSAKVIKGGCQAWPVSHSPGPGRPTRSQLPVHRRRRRRRPGCVSAPTEPAACRRGGHGVRRRRRRAGPGPCRGNVTVIVGRRCSWRFGAGPGPGSGRGRRTCVNAARRPGWRAAPAAGGESAATRSVTVTPLGSPGAAACRAGRHGDSDSCRELST